MGGEGAVDPGRIERRIVGLYNLLYADELAEEDIELYELTDPNYEGEIDLPHIGLNFELWAGWSTEKRVEVLLHEFAHAEKYEDDHHPDFWDRVVDLTEVAVDRRAEVGDLFDDDLDADALRRTVVESVHEYVIERDIDTVAERRRAVGRALGVAPESACSD